MAVRTIIYVDAGKENKNTSFNVAFYNQKNAETGAIALANEVKDASYAEKLAIAYAVYYIIKKNIDNAHILCDNQGVANNKDIQEFCNSRGIGLSWIPREINEIADKATRNKVTYNAEEYNMIQFILNTMISTK